MKCGTLIIGLGLALACAAPAATLTLSNYNAGSTALHGIADKSGARLAPGAGAGVIGRMKTLSDTQVQALVDEGDIAALDADFEVFDPVSGAFDLANLEEDGAFEVVLSADTRASQNAFGGSAIYVWLYKGASRIAAEEFFLAKLGSQFPTDPEDLPPLGPVEVRVMPGNLAQLFSGAVGPGEHDYGLGGGPALVLRMGPFTEENRAPVALDSSINVAPGLPFNGQVEATDADLDTLTYILVQDAAKGELDFESDGSYTYTADPLATGQDSFTFKANDDNLDSNVATVTIHIGVLPPQSQTITFNPPPQRTVAEAPFALEATASSGLPVVFEILSGPASVEGDVVTLQGVVGTVYVRATQPGNAQFDPAPPVVQYFHVTAVTSTPTLGHLKQVYTGSPLTVSLAGVSPGTEVTIAYNGSETPPTNAGSYNVVATIAGGPTKKGKFTIAKAPLTAAADDKTRLIGETNPELTFSYNGFLGADTAETVFPEPATKTAKAPVISTTATPKSPAGAYPIKLSGGKADNYTLVYENAVLIVDGFAGLHEILLASEADLRPGAKVELNVAKSVKLAAGGNKLSVSGKLSVPGETAALSLKGDLNIDAQHGEASGPLTVSKKNGAVTNTYVVTPTITVTGELEATLQINGVLAASGANGRRIFTPAKGQTLSFTGSHTAIIAPPASPGPEGSGHATGNIDRKAVLKLAGKLADGRAFTSSLRPAFEDEDGDVVSYRLFAQPYKRRESYAAGWINLTPHPDLPLRRHVSSGANAVLVWAKLGSNSDKSYRAGFGPLDCDFTLDPWIKPAKATRNTPAILLSETLGLAPDGSFAVAHSAFASPSFEDLPTGLTVQDSNNRINVTVPADNLTGWKVKSLKVTNGVFTGEAVLKKETPKARKITFSGILRQPPSGEASAVIGRGHFLLPPELTGGETVSGDVLFTAP